MKEAGQRSGTAQVAEACGGAPPAPVATPALWAALRRAGVDPGWIPTAHCLVLGSDVSDPRAAAFCGGRAPVGVRGPGGNQRFGSGLEAAADDAAKTGDLADASAGAA